MNLDLKSDKLSFMKSVFRRRFVREETVEAIVPDAQPDILRILDTDGMVFLRSKDSEAGRVSVTGTAELTVLYVPETGGGVKKIAVSVPFAASAEGADITADSLITARVYLTGADARTVNPRKVVVRAEIACEAGLYVTETVYNTSPRERDGVYFKSGDVELRLPASVNEKTFVFTDEARLPAGAADIGEILRAVTSLQVESAKAVGSKAVVKGSAVTSLLYEAREGGLCRETLTTPFSQIVDADDTGEEGEFELTPCLTGVYVNRNHMDDTGAEALTLEIHAVIQCVTYRTMRASAVTDAYSTKHPLTGVTARCEFECLLGRETRAVTAPVSIPVAGRASEVRAVTAKNSGASCREGAEGPEYRAAINVTVIYMDASGELLSASRKAELTEPLGEGGEDADVELGFTGEPFTAIEDGTIEVRVPVELGITRLEARGFDRMESVELDEEAKLDLSDMPNLTVTRAGAGKGLWELAKEHMSTVELIRSTNALEGEPEDGALLLIPRCG